MTRVKICGIKDEACALVAVEGGADFVGLVFAPSTRQVTPTQAQEIANAVRKGSGTTELVGVFVNMPAPEVNKTADFCGLDWVQLSGDEPWEYCCQITKPIIKAVRLRQGQNAQEICAVLDTGTRVLDNRKHIYLLDTQVKGKYGGTGIAFNWELAQQVAERFPVIIAGGLTPENVARAIEVIAPWGVDISSGVEIGGTKHPARIRAFIEAVRKVDESKG